MKIFSIALTLGLLVVASDVRADRPPGNQVMIRPTHDRYAVTLMLSLSGSTACGPNYEAMALLGPGGGIIQDPFIVPPSSVFVATDFEWEATPVLSDQPFSSDDDVVLVPVLYRSRFQGNVVDQKLAVGHRSLETGMGWHENLPVCVGAKRRYGTGEAGLAWVYIQGFVDDLKIP